MLSVNLFTNWNIKTRSLNFPEWLINYSRLIKSNYQWYSGNKIYCLVLKNKFKKCKHVYNKVSSMSKQLYSDETFTSLMSMHSLSLTNGSPQGLAITAWYIKGRFLEGESNHPIKLIIAIFIFYKHNQLVYWPLQITN